MSTPARPINPSNQVASWEGGWTVHQIDLPIPVPTGIGRWLVRQGLYSQGNDFTSAEALANPNHHGISTLLKMWKGQRASALENMGNVRVLVLAQGHKACGVVTWVQPDTSRENMPWDWFSEATSHPRHHPKRRLAVGRIGHLMAFIKPEHRNQGLVRRAISEVLMPDILACARRYREQQIMPLLGASDAMSIIVGQLCDVPLTECTKPSKAMRQQAWGYINEARGAPEIECLQSPWYVDPQHYPKLRPGVSR